MKYARYLVALFALTCVWMTYDNVLSDEAPIKALAEQAACNVKRCTDQHGMTRMSRTPIGVSFQFEWKDGTVPVTCRREYFVVGARVCSTN